MSSDGDYECGADLDFDSVRERVKYGLHLIPSSSAIDVLTITSAFSKLSRLESSHTIWRGLRISQHWVSTNTWPPDNIEKSLPALTSVGVRNAEVKFNRRPRVEWYAIAIQNSNNAAANPVNYHG